MESLKVGDIVARNSYECDIFFKVVNISNGIVTLKGICYRIEADAPMSDLVLQSDNYVRDYNRKVDSIVDKRVRNSSPIRASVCCCPFAIKKNARNYYSNKNTRFFKSGKVLHIDGDNEYLETCLKKYSEAGITAIGVYAPEKEQASQVQKLLDEYNPDILVLTGHDGIIKEKSNKEENITNYRNSKHYVSAVKEARRFENDIDSLVIFAGACQSMFSEIIKAGANFASSPKRVLIHALDPVFVCKQVALTSASVLILPTSVVNTTITGADGIGGIQTWGKLREGYPAFE